MKGKSDKKADKAVDKKMAKPPKDKKVKLNPKVDNTAYRKEELKANHPHKMPKMVKRDKKVGKTKYD